MTPTSAADFAARIVLGPAAVLGRRADGNALPRPDGGLVAASLEFVDDEFALVGDEPIAVAELWRSIFGSMLRGVAGPVELIVPASWPAPRVEAVTGAVDAVAGEPVVTRRAAILATGDPPPAIVEIAGDVVVLCRGADQPVLDLQCRDGSDPPTLADAVAVSATAEARVLIDCPTEVPQAAALATMIATRIRARGCEATVIAGDDLLLGAPADPPVGTEWAVRRGPTRRRAGWVAAMTVATAATVAVVAVTRGDDASPPTALFVEGRVALEVPPHWSVQRITGGPGSARVQFTAPVDGAPTLHLTQAPLPPGHGLAEVSATLRAAASAAPPGVFADYDDRGLLGDRAVIRYRENRPGRSIEWTVVVDDAVRIGIGCQGATPTAFDDAVCAAAVRSARVLDAPTAR